MIGHLQRNKIKMLLPHARLIHSLASQRLADAIELQAADLDVPVDAFIEVNVGRRGEQAGDRAGCRGPARGGPGGLSPHLPAAA